MAFSRWIVRGTAAGPLLLAACGGGGDATTGSGGATATSSTGGAATSSGSGGTATSSGTGTGPRCGDGHVDPGEACDDGNTDDLDACKSDCTPGPCAAPGYLGSLAHRCSDLPLLLDPGYATLGLLPFERPAGTWNPYVWDGNLDADARPAIRARADALGVGAYWLLYGHVFEGLDPYRLQRGSVPHAGEYHGRPLVDECYDATDTGGSGAACVAQLDGCGMAVGGQDPTALAAAYDGWVADHPTIEQTLWNNHRTDSPPGFLPDGAPVASIEMAQIDMEGACFGHFVSRQPGAADLARAHEVLGRAHDGLRQGLDSGALAAGSGAHTEIGVYGVPFPQNWEDATAGGNATLPPLITDGTLGGYADACPFFAPQIAYEKCGGAGQVCDPHKLRISHLGLGYGPVARLLPWMYFTGRAPSEHPAFTWLPATSDGDPMTYEAPDVVAWANASVNAGKFFDHYFRGPSSDTSMPGANSRMDTMPGTVQFPSIYQAAGRIRLAWGDVAHPAWNRNSAGLGAPAFGHETTAPTDPHDAAVYDYLLESELESANLANRLALEVAWAWKLWKGRRLAPILTVLPGGAAFDDVLRDPAGGADLCTTRTLLNNDDPSFPSRCGPVPAACSVGGVSGVRITDVPRHPGRTTKEQLWNAATSKYDPMPGLADEPYYYVKRGTELPMHQSRAEFERTQVLPMIQAVPKGGIDAVTTWPDEAYLVGICAGQAHRLAAGGGFPSFTVSYSRENGGAPEAYWMQFFVPGPLDRWCHLPGNDASCHLALDPTKSCGATDTCEPGWASLGGQHAIEELCTEAIDGYVLDRWQWIREAFEIAHGPNPPSTHQRQPTAFCTYLESWFTAKYGPPASPLCQ